MVSTHKHVRRSKSTHTDRVYAPLSTALAAVKAQGVRLGKPENLHHQDTGRVQGCARRTVVAGERAADLRPIIADLRASDAAPRVGVRLGIGPLVSH